MVDEKFRDLIHRRFTGSLSDPERAELSTWIHLSKSNRDYYKTCEKFYTSVNNEFSSEDVGKYWPQLKARIDCYEHEKKHTQSDVLSFPLYLKIAAGFLLLVSATFLIIQVKFSDRLVTYTNSYAVPVFQYLPDSSVVWLNSGSTISYNRQFDSRAVELIGEAFFEVRKNPENPFTVVSSKSEVTVLGTSFNLRAGHKKENIELSVVTGVVRFKALTSLDSEVIVIAGKRAIYDHQKKAVLDLGIADTSVLDWRSSALVFNKAALDKVVETFNAYFHRKLLLDPSVSACRFTGSLRGLSVEEALTILSLSMNLEVTKAGGHIILKGSGCNDQSI